MVAYIRRTLAARCGQVLVRRTVAGIAMLFTTPAIAQDRSMSHDLAIGSMIGGADPLVKVVMAILLIASIATWTVLFVKIRELNQAKRQLRGDVTVLDQANSFQAVTVRSSAARAMVDVARRELARDAAPRSPGTMEGIKERVAARLTVIETNAVQSILSGVTILASIGATAPFIGLAGTVWGIMNSFIGISRSHATNLAVVAPGIAEALLATAMGLIAAIPAVLIYNMLARLIAGYRRMVAEAAVLTACMLSRELEGERGADPGTVRSVVRATA